MRLKLRERRRAKFVAQLSEQYRRTRPALPASREPRPPPEASPPRRKVTVAELVVRLEAEGLPTKLRWDRDDGSSQPDKEDWPTEVLGQTDRRMS